MLSEPLHVVAKLARAFDDLGIRYVGSHQPDAQ